MSIEEQFNRLERICCNLDLRHNKLHERMDDLEGPFLINRYEAYIFDMKIMTNRLDKLEATIGAMKGTLAALVGNNNTLNTLTAHVNDLEAPWQDPKFAPKRIDLDEFRTALAYINDGVEQLNHLFKDGE